MHAPSFELGAGTAFVEMLGTMQQRSILGDAIRAATEAPRGTEILHLVGVLSLSTAAATQGGLADRLGIDRGNFNRYVRRLADAGLIQSQRSSRRVDYRPLPLGLEVLNYLRPGWKALDPKTNTLLQFEECIRASVKGETTDPAGLGKNRKEVSVLELLEAVTASHAVFGSEHMRMGKMASHRSFGISRASTSQTEFLQEVA
ncbi:winged helix-turn-helix domain-containing protein [Rhodanobacter sp. AS-Z3]|uniref:winged helix-turn-helix domain-containing protein n=1 Tax=Rhodanobacter sp. AS-Z3 TaxID=3031330 RepID=UPI00247964F2|nr:winged helix-turn-helix domain-containing protein [Rhodanobacter sp. AS-Z3]WEN13785.1 winged helix-turn-helix domain-containing protein [Rhodanobacter sp. AS-Z3]